ncbi:hypothetical protein [Streptacidiphilus carbonis]|uniref:hypothetical protein n=1 Tax=Streptacidiphilus carbonis TaxID=105422 RepID=UPI0005A7BD4C|nr:hypothetical protein [Streptacidiphilus carbonis]
MERDLTPKTAADLLPKAAPALATTTVLTLARIWNANGAHHSTGDAALMTILAIAAGAAGGATSGHSDTTTSTIAFTASGALALAGVAAYATGLALPLLLWSVATVLAYVLSAKHWRTERREAVAHQRTTEIYREDHRHVETVESIRARAQIEVAQHATSYALALEQALASRAALPGYNPNAITANGLPALPTSQPAAIESGEAA